MSNTIYEKNDVLVDASRYMVEGTMYPINSVASVAAYAHDKSSQRRAIRNDWLNGNATDLQELKDSRKKAIIATILGAATLYFFTNGFGLSIFTLALIYLAYALYSLNKFVESPEPEGPTDSYSVKISTAAGETDSYRSYSRQEINNIVTAINEAVLVRG